MSGLIAKFLRTDTDFLADFRARIRSRPVQLADLSGPQSYGRADFCATHVFLARMSVGDARVYTCTCIVHDKLVYTFTKLHDIRASLKSGSPVSVSVSVSVLWNLSFSNGTIKF